VPAAQLYVDLIGAEAIVEEGRHAFDAGDYRWAAQILHHLVFAQPDNRPPGTCRPTPTSRWATRSRARSGVAPFLTAASLAGLMDTFDPADASMSWLAETVKRNVSLVSPWNWIRGALNAQ
jgi:hypothetical protein